jgi:hypothetical protein
MELKLWIREVEIVNSWTWNREIEISHEWCPFVANLSSQSKISKLTISRWNLVFMNLKWPNRSFVPKHGTLWVSVEIGLGITGASWKWRNLSRYNNFDPAYRPQKAREILNGLIGLAGTGEIWAEMTIYRLIFGKKSAKYQGSPDGPTYTCGFLHHPTILASAELILGLTGANRKWRDMSWKYHI